jgi:hypothetical protein
MVVATLFAARPGFAQTEPVASAPDFGRPGRIVAGPDGFAQDLPGGIRVELGPGAEVMVSRPTKTRLMGAKDRSTRLVSVELLSGRITAGVAPSAILEHSVLVRAPGKISFIPTGGRVTVLAKGTSDVAATVPDGQALYALGNEWRELPAGEMRTFSRGLQTGQGPLFSAPTLRIEPRLLLASESSPASVRVHVEGLSAGTVPRVELRRRTDKGEAVLQRLSEAEPVFAGLVPGSYVVTATLVGASGLESKTAGPVEVRVIGVELPPGATLQDGALLLLPGQRVKLLEGAGLKMTYGDGSSYFVSAPKDFGLGRAKGGTVRFRIADGKDEARIVLKQRPYRAQIKLEPENSKRGGPVRIVLQVTDASGRPAPRKLSRAVTVDAQPVMVSWNEEDGVLKGTVKPPPGKRSWTLRVEAADDLGPVATASLQVGPQR